MAFLLYLIYIASFFLHLTQRVPVLGAVRFDLIIVILIIVFIAFQNKKNFHSLLNKNGAILLALLLYIVFSLPFVQWPGTVLRVSMENYVKVLVFYFFTVLTVTDERRLRILLVVFAVCQMFRICEPLYMNWTSGYWGDSASMEDGLSMNRLAGSPFDIINPNGLAYVCITAFAFLFYLSKTMPILLNIAGYALIPIIIHALILTGSRSGMLAFIGLIMGIILFSRKKILLFGIIIIMAIAAFPYLNQEQQERYLSIYRDDVRGASTAQGRIDGLVNDFEVVKNSPIFGHGLGTSLEAKFNIGQSRFISHNLIMEVWQEIGLIGLILFSSFLFSSINFYVIAKKRVNQSGSHFLIMTTRVMGLWLIGNVIFAMFSYGLSSYTWYMFAGLSVVLMMLSSNQCKQEDRKRHVERKDKITYCDQAPSWRHQNVSKIHL